jgi:uncharacterized protein
MKRGAPERTNDGAGRREKADAGMVAGPKERPVRRCSDAMNDASARQALIQGDWGVLSTVGPDGWPYGVPLDYVVLGDALYVHGAPLGHRAENVGHCPRVSFCVVASTTIRPEAISRDYASVIVFGTAKTVVGEEKRRALEAFLEKYCAPVQKAARKYLDHEFDRTFVTRVTIERLTGKDHKPGPRALAAPTQP